MLLHLSFSFQDQFENSLDMILFLTDGTPSESKVNDILEEIAIGQNNMVIFLILHVKYSMWINLFIIHFHIEFLEIYCMILIYSVSNLPL